MSTYTNTTGTNPIFLAFDNSNINLYYSYGGGNSIYKVTGPSETPTLFTNAGIANPRGIAFDSSGNLYVVNTAGGVAITKFNSGGTIIANSTSSAATSGLRGCVCDNSNNLYVADQVNGRIWKCDASLNLQGFTIAGSIPNAASIVFDGSTYLYVSTGSASKTVFRVDLNGSVTNFYPNNSFTNNASGLTYNRFNNNLYSLDNTAKTIYVDSINQYTFTGTSFSTPNTAYTLTITDASSAIITNSLTLNTGSAPIPVPCFKKDTKILCMNDFGETVYMLIQNIRPGTLVKTFRNGFLPVDMIGTSKIYNSGNNERTKNRLYRCSKYHYPELNEDLIITGCHSILETKLTQKQEEKTVDLFGELYVTDEKYRLMAYIDDRAKPYEVEGDFSIYHIALENDDYYTNYGIYANGLLVETCSKRTLTELSNMTLLH